MNSSADTPRTSRQNLESLPENEEPSSVQVSSVFHRGSSRHHRVSDQTTFGEDFELSSETLSHRDHRRTHPQMASSPSQLVRHAANSSSRSNTDGSDGRRHLPTQETSHEHRENRPTERYNSPARQDSSEAAPQRSEHTLISRRDLNAFDVAALIINKQIGTGIFTTPGLILSLTGSKTISLIMWFCGGIWAFLSVIIYAEFGCAFPFNGGELIYLDEVFKTPELLATALFSAFFIMIPNTDGNSLQFAKHVLLAAEPTVSNTTQLDRRLLCYVAITVLTIVTLVHYFSRNSGLFLNLLFAGFKICLVIAFIIAGLKASSNPDNGKSDWGAQPVPARNVMGGMIYVIYSYQGWENANYVGGELRVDRRSLKSGAFGAVAITTILYTLVTLAYCLVLRFDELAASDLAIIVRFVPKAFGPPGVVGAKICIALSAFGNLIAVVYTSARVKQQIARQCIIPFYKFFAAEDPQFHTPYGALILHWVFAVAWILGTPNTADGYGFIIGLFIYGQLVVGVFVAYAFFSIRKTYEQGFTRNSSLTQEPLTWEPVFLKNKLVRIVAGLIFMGMNMMVLVEGARSLGHPPSWVQPTMIFSLLGLVIILWAGLGIVAKRSGSESSIEIRVIRNGVGKPTKEDEPILKKAIQEENSRVVIYKVHGHLESILKTTSKYLHKLFRFLSR